MQTSNPTLATFEKPQTWDDLNAREAKLGAMTISGAISASAVLLGVCAAAAFATWAFMPDGWLWPALIGSAILGLVLTLVIVFKPRTAPFLSFPGAAVEGVFVGAASVLYAAIIGGMEVASADGASVSILASAGSHIVVQAVLLTFGVFLAMLAAYGSRLIRPTPMVIKGIMGATGGVVFLMLGWWVLRLFMGSTIPSMWDMGWWGIGIAGVIVVVAAFNLVIDFHVIEDGAKQGAPKYYEWVAAFGLMITLVWLYVSILRLLALLAFNRE